MRVFSRVVLSLFLSLIYSGCGSSSSTKTQMRAIQASPNQPTTLNVLLGGTTVFSNLALGAPTNYMTVTSGSQTLEVEPSDSSTASISQTVTLNSSTNYTLITANYPASLTPILLTDNTTPPSTGYCNLRIVNAAVEAGSVDVYVQAPGAADPSTGGVSPTVASLGFTSSSSYQSLAAGSWNIIVTPAGYPVVKYVNTGSISFAAGSNRTLVILPNGSGGITSVTLADLN